MLHHVLPCVPSFSLWQQPWDTTWTHEHFVKPLWVNTVYIEFSDSLMIAVQIWPTADTFIRPTYRVEWWPLGGPLPDLSHKEAIAMVACQPRANRINQNRPKSGPQFISLLVGWSWPINEKRIVSPKCLFVLVLFGFSKNFARKHQNPPLSRCSPLTPMQICLLTREELFWETPLCSPHNLLIR